MIPENLPPQFTFEEKMETYAELLGYLKEEIAKQGENPFDIGDFFQFQSADQYADYLAAMAFFEEYELLEYFFSKQVFSDQKRSATDLLNMCVSSEFAAWQPTPLYFITGKRARKKMNDICKMLRFLVKHGADVNRAAGDGSTPLWNQTNLNGTFEILQTLLELGADPNQVSIDGEYEAVPLANCLLPDDDDDEFSWKPFDLLAINKAKLLLEYGANPNLANPTSSDWPPLALAVKYGIPPEQTQASDDLLELIELLLKNGADPNFIDGDGSMPLIDATENLLFEVGQLLLLYGAKLPETIENLDQNT